MAERVPTTDDVRGVYVDAGHPDLRLDNTRNFNHWLAAHDREVAEEALRDAARAEEARCEGDWNGTTCDTCTASAQRLHARAVRIARGEVDL